MTGFSSKYSSLPEIEHYHVEKAAFIHDWLANLTDRPCTRGRTRRRARERKQVERFVPPPPKRVKKSTPQEKQSKNNKLPELPSISFNPETVSKVETKKSSPVKRRNELQYFNPVILFVAPDQDRYDDEVPEIVRTLILRFLPAASIRLALHQSY
jgi:hypothetical protein